MDKTHHRTVEKELWKVFDKLRGVEFHGPEELAEFLKYENIHFTADELVAFGTILATRYKRLGPPALHIPGWLADVYSKLLEDISPQIICDPWAGAGLLIA